MCVRDSIDESTFVPIDIYISVRIKSSLSLSASAHAAGMQHFHFLPVQSLYQNRLLCLSRSRSRETRKSKQKNVWKSLQFFVRPNVQRVRDGFSRKIASRQTRKKGADKFVFHQYLLASISRLMNRAPNSAMRPATLNAISYAPDANFLSRRLTKKLRYLKNEHRARILVKINFRSPRYVQHW